jgi:hypothetical protein
MRKTAKFTLGPRPTASSPRAAPKRAPKIEVTRSRAASTQADVAEDEYLPEPELALPERKGLPRAQLELEYKAALQEREVVLHELGKCLKDLMVSVPPN